MAYYISGLTCIQKIELNIKSDDILNSIYEISKKRRIMLYNRSKFILESKRSQLPYNQKLIARIGEDPSYNEEQERKMREEMKAMSRVTMQSKTMGRFKDSGGVGEFMYDALDPGNYISKARDNLRRVDASFDRCFSHFFKTPSEIKLENNRKRIRNSKSEKTMPRAATRDSLLVSLRNLRKMKFAKKHDTTMILRTMQSARLGSTKMMTSVRDFRINTSRKKANYYRTARKNKANESLLRFKSTRSKVLDTRDTGSLLRSTITNEREAHDKKGDPPMRAIDFNFAARRTSYAEKMYGKGKKGLKKRLKIMARDRTVQNSPKNCEDGSLLYNLLSQDDCN